MRPIEKATLDKLKARLAETREAEYQAVIDLANAPLSVTDVRLNELKLVQLTVRDLQECINRLERECSVKSENAEAEVYASKEPTADACETRREWETQR